MCLDKITVFQQHAHIVFKRLPQQPAYNFPVVCRKNVGGPGRAFYIFDFMIKNPLYAVCCINAERF